MTPPSDAGSGPRPQPKPHSRRRQRGGRLPKVQRVGAYAVILRVSRDGAAQEILLSRLSDTLTSERTWTLPGGGLDHGEDPRAAVVREVYEETGLDVRIGETAWVLSAHRSNTWRRGRRVDAHALRIVYDGWVSLDAPEPHTVEVGGSTAEAAWLPLADVLSGEVGTLPLVKEALEVHRPVQLQRVAAYALIRRHRDGAPAGEVLLTRISARGFHSGQWTLPGGGIDFGENPRDALVREVREECGVTCVVGRVRAVHDVALQGTAPNGRFEDFHGIHLVFDASLEGSAADVEPHVVEVDGTTDAVAWVSEADIESGAVPVLDVVRAALQA